MSAPLAMRRSMVGAAVESASGTAEAIAAALANTAVYNSRFRPLGFFDDGERRPDGNSLGTLPRTKGMQLGEGSFMTEYRHGDGTYTLLQGAGYVLSGASSEIALPTSDLSARKTLTLKNWEDGRYQLIHGAVATAVRLAPTGTGQRLMWNWTFRGIWDNPGDEAMPTMPDIDAATPVMRARGMTVLIATAAIPKISTFELNFGIQAEPREDLTATHGLAHMLIGERNPQLTIDPEADLVANYDAFGKFEAGTVEAVQLEATDGTETLTIDIPAGQRIELEPTERGSKKVDRVRIECHNTDAGNDDLKFTKSAA